MSHKGYIEKLLQRYGIHDCKPLDILISKGDKLSLIQCPKNTLEIQEMQNFPYAQVVGSLMYAQVCSRPDIAYIVRVLGRCMSNPGMTHWEAAKRVLRYVHALVQKNQNN